MSSSTNVLALFLAALLLAFSLGVAAGSDIDITSRMLPIGQAEPVPKPEGEDDLFTLGQGVSSLDTTNWSQYSNLVMGYSVKVPNNMRMLSDQEVMEAFQLDQISEDEDQLYDMRVWVGDSSIIELQYKEPTFGSFEEEVERSPEYYDMIKDNFDGSRTMSNLVMLHQGELRDTHLGQLLEQAYTYKMTVGMQSVDVTVVYWDYYYDEDTEIIFYIEGYQTSAEALRPILEAMVSTFEHLPAPGALPAPEQAQAAL